jgi:hypothetical protein
MVAICSYRHRLRMGQLARWSAIWASPPGRGSIEVWDEGLVLDGWDDAGRNEPVRLRWDEVRSVSRARSAERLNGIGTLVFETETGNRQVAPLECGVLTMLERIAHEHLH